MRIPKLVLMRRHNVAALTVSFGRIWNTRETGDLILGYNACGRLARVVFLDPRAALPVAPSERDAVRIAMAILASSGHAESTDLDVLESALRRAPGPRSDTRSGPAFRTG